MLFKVLRQPSLRRQLLVWLLLPQFLLWGVGAGITYAVALRFTNQTNDRALLAASRSLARQIKPLDSGLLIDLPKAAQHILEEDPVDQLLYTVSSPPGEFILGNKNLPLPPSGVSKPSEIPFFYDQKFGHETLRVVAMYYRLPHYPDNQWMLVQIGKNAAERRVLAKEIFSEILLPQSALLLLATILVWTGVGRGLFPLKRLRRAVEERSVDDLSPVKIETAPAEVLSLVVAVNKLLERLRNQIVIQRQFIADAAHQLRTPLAGLKTQTELALRLKDPLEQQASLKQIQISTERAVRLANQLLSLARAEPEAALELHPVDLTELARVVTEQWVPQALTHEIDLGFECDAGQAMVSGHAIFLRELLSNLIDNSLRYCPNGSEVTVRVLRRAGSTRLQIEDNGPGIPEGERERVLARFYRLPTHSGQSTGCGLGLAIVKEIVVRHGGNIELTQSDYGSGLLVNIAFPPAPTDTLSG